MLIKTIIVGLLVLTAPVSLATEKIINWAQGGIYVIDGDTYKIGKKRYRLCGINTPEKGQSGYQEAGAALKLLMQRSGDINIITVDVGRYGREIVIMQPVKFNSTINEALVAAGFARHYKRFSRNCAPYIKVKNLVELENNAKRQKKGIWSSQ